MSYTGGTGPNVSPAVAPVAGTQILLKRTDTLGKKPDAGAAAYGELFINYHSGGPFLCFKDNANTIVELRPVRFIDGGGGDTLPPSGNTTGDLIWDGSQLHVWNGSAWEPIAPSDLSYVAAADKGTVVNSAGDDAELPLATDALAGLMSPADKGKLDDYPADPNTIAPTVNLAYTAAADKGTVTNTAGSDAELPLADGTNAGLSLNNYTTAEKDKLDGIEDGAEANLVTSVFGRTGDVVAVEGDYDLGQLGDVDTTGTADGNVLAYSGSSWGPVSPAGLAIDVDLDYTAAPDKGIVTNTAGDDAELPLVGSVNAGLMTPGDKNKLDAYPNDPAAITPTVDLGYTPAADRGTVTNTAGANATLPLVTSSEAGLMSPGDKTKLDNASASDLQGVTDAGNETDNDILMTGTGVIQVPSGTTAEQPSPPAEGMLRYNSDDNVYEGYNDSEWVQILDHTVVGTSPDQVPANQMLGRMAFIDHCSTLRPYTTPLASTLPVFVGECIVIWDDGAGELVYRYRDTDTTYREAKVTFGAQVTG